ncbi:MAG: A/G-specific adenine glycosylase [Nitrospirae bacterium]|nr:A/G-specific adenine glycosylase [Nitrospirota bacterium]
MPPRRSHRADPKQLQQRLLIWYRRNKRDLPWRKTGDPYRILVSEIMLQQTQVVTVIPYYRRFIKTFPTVSSLARAPLQKVLKLWEGLGYYSRARNLHRAAQVIKERWKGKVPSTVEELSALPGIGRYTAGAVASIAFNIKTPILDGNVRRVLCRIFAIRKAPRQAVVQDRLWSLAAEILPEQNVGDFNQALMELGATVCLPRTPSCMICPLRESCRAYQTGLQDRLPIRVKRRTLPHHKMLVALIQNGRGLLIGPRPERGLLAGLWGFPEIDWKEATTSLQIEEAIKNRLGLKTNLLRPLEPVVHTFTHKRITYHPYLFNCISTQNRLPASWQWIPLDKIADYPLPNATRKIFDQIATDRLPLAAEQPAVYRKRKNVLGERQDA